MPGDVKKTQIRQLLSNDLSDQSLYGKEFHQNWAVKETGTCLNWKPTGAIINGHSVQKCTENMVSVYGQKHAYL